MDINDITTIVELMKSHDLTHFELDREGVKLTLKRSGGDSEAMAAALAGLRAATPAPVAIAAPAPVAVAAPAAGGEAPVAAPAGDPNVTIIKSPMVGTFYRSSGPGQAPFINVGDTVGPDSTVCIIEAMKVMNEIKAECSGRIVRILVEDATPVQYGQPLFEVKP